jgi:hypothetical protein
MESYPVLSEHDSNQILSSKSLVVSEEEVPDSTRESQKAWKPRTLSIATLISAAIFTGGLAVILGILQWQNNRHGALFFASTLGGFSFSENFLYRYFPTIIVVLYGLAWSWIDLDVKRLEPWFQLAQKGGTSAERSLLLQYPVDFLPLVPFKAAKLRSVILVFLEELKLTSFCQAMGCCQRLLHHGPCQLGRHSPAERPLQQQYNRRVKCDLATHDGFIPACG